MTQNQNDLSKLLDEFKHIIIDLNNTLGTEYESCKTNKNSLSDVSTDDITNTIKKTIDYSEILDEIFFKLSTNKFIIQFQINIEDNPPQCVNKYLELFAIYKTSKIKNKCVKTLIDFGDELHKFETHDIKFDHKNRIFIKNKSQYDDMRNYSIKLEFYSDVIYIFRELLFLTNISVIFFDNLDDLVKESKYFYINKESIKKSSYT